MVGTLRRFLSPIHSSSFPLQPSAMASAAAATLLPFPPHREVRSARPLRRILPPFRRSEYLSSFRKCGLCHHRCFHSRQNATREVLSSHVKIEDSLDDEACELVNGVQLIMGEGEDNIRAYLFKAVKNNNGNGILLLSDVFGFEDSSTRDFAYRVACSGYNVLVPDLFRGSPWKKGEAMTKFEHWLARQSPERVAKDIDMSAKWMIDEFVAAAGVSKKLGIIGFCFGGGVLIETLARDEQGYFSTGVCFYGTRMDPSLGSSIKVPVLFVSGDNDPLCPVGTLHEMEKNIRGSKVVTYSGRGHGFAHRPSSQEEDEDAEDAFAIMRNWLHDGLLESTEKSMGEK